MTTRRKPKVVHICTKEELLDRIGLVLFGDGTPEDGISFMFRESLKHQETLSKDVQEIKGKVTEAIESSGKAVRALESYKKEISTVELTKEKMKSTRKEKFEKTVRLIEIFVIVIGLGFTIYQVIKGNEKTDKKLDGLGSPVIVNARGDITPLPYGDSIKYFTKKGYNDFKDTTK
jgi:hypothetical protein